MPQIKGLWTAGNYRRPASAISDAIHQSIVDVLRVLPEKRFHRFFPLSAENFIYPDDRGEDYLVIEISLFKGRSKETLKQLIRTIFRQIEAEAGISPHSVEITIHQSPREHWGIRGQPGDELDLPYRIEQSRDLS